jgi:hypothetical protein
MHNKHLIRLFFILTFLFLSSGAYLLLPDRPKTETPQPLVQNISWTNVATNTAISEKTDTATAKKIPEPAVKEMEIKKNEELKTETASSTSADIKNPIAATIKINDQQYELSLSEKSTVYDALQKLTMEKKITISMKEFSGLGYFVEEINGTKNDNQAGQYWIYYINGQSAKVGISSYILKNNDLITWKYEAEKF